MSETIRKNIIFIFLLLGVCMTAQEKKQLGSIPQVLKSIIPDDRTDFWVLVHNHYGKNEELKISGAKKDYVPQSSGFNLFPEEDSFYYIAYSKAGKVDYITDLSGLKTFIGTIDNVEEAVIDATAEGYFIDEEFKNVAGNYYQDASNYYIDLGKLTSKECPYQKTHFTLTVNKSSGKVTGAKNNGTYIELYNKKCTNNPRLLKIEKKEVPADEPQKTKQPVRRK